MKTKVDTSKLKVNYEKFKVNYEDTICCECNDNDPDPNSREDPARKGYYEIQWVAFPTRPKMTDGGLTSWAKLLRTTNTDAKYNKLEAYYRFHLCKFDPCIARHELSKYGQMPEPTHVRIVPKREPIAVDELPSSAVASSDGAAADAAAVADSSSSIAASFKSAPEEAAVAEFPSSAVASTETVPGEAAVAESSSSAVASSETEATPEAAAVSEAAIEKPVPEEAVMAEGHTLPKGAPLRALAPPAPAAPVECSNVAYDVDAVACAPDIEPAVAARGKIEARLLKLAREIREPRSYVGYAAFILMGLLKKCRPCVFEGATHIDLLEVFATWALSYCTDRPAVRAVPCALKATASGAVELMPICEEHPLHTTRHFVGAVAMEAPDISEDAMRFDVMYAEMGVGILPTVLDGDCGMDVMTDMLGIDQTVESRNALRRELSDYLFDRIAEPWMHDIMAACQELEWDDVHALRASASDVPLKPVATPPAVAEAIADTLVVTEVVRPDEETVAAMCWASNINDRGTVLALIEGLPKKIVEEQVMLYRKRDQAIVATQDRQPPKIQIGANCKYMIKMRVARRWHEALLEEGYDNITRIPRGFGVRFIKNHIIRSTKDTPLRPNTIKQWHAKWLASRNVVSAVAGHDEGPSQVQARNMHFARANLRHVLPEHRRRAPGGGTKCKVFCVRQESVFLL